MHLALFNIPLTLAVRFRIPLVVWGENSAFEYGSAEEAHTGFALDGAWLKTYGVTHGTKAADWIDEELTAKELTPYFGPSDERAGRGRRARGVPRLLPAVGSRRRPTRVAARARLPRRTRRRAPATTTTPISTTTSSRFTTG